MMAFSSSCARTRSFVAFTFGLALCGALAAWIARQSVDWRAFASGFSVLSICGVLFLSHALMRVGTRKWAVLSETLHGIAGKEPEKGFFARHYLWHNWIGQFVPSGLALVLGRGVSTRSMAGVGARAGIVDGLWDQAMEYVFFAGLLPAGALFMWQGLSDTLFLLTALIGLFFALGTFYCGVFFLEKKLLPALPKLLFLSGLRASLTIARLCVGVSALGLSFDPLAVVAAAAVVSLVALVPLAPGNLGLAEWGWVGALAATGEDPARAALFALGFRVLVFACQTILVLAHALREKRLSLTTRPSKLCNNDNLTEREHP